MAPDLSHRFEAESVARTLDLVGERWTLLILREAFFGVRRFGQFTRNLNISRPTLSARLRTLVDAGLLERVLYSSDPERHEYRLTDANRVAPQFLLADRRTAIDVSPVRRRDRGTRCHARARAGISSVARIRLSASDANGRAEWPDGTRRGASHHRRDP